MPTSWLIGHIQPFTPLGLAALLGSTCPRTRTGRCPVAAGRGTGQGDLRLLPVRLASVPHLHIRLLTPPGLMAELQAGWLCACSADGPAGELGPLLSPYVVVATRHLARLEAGDKTLISFS